VGGGGGGGGRRVRPPLDPPLASCICIVKHEKQ
jgi:hypothetical protein